MDVIQYLEGHVIYENPKPQVNSRHGYFPGLVLLPSGELIALFMMAEAFEAPNGTTYISRSRDSGRTWELQGKLYEESVLGFETTDTMKATVLRDGTLIAIGYRFHRHDPEQGIALEETGGILPGDDIVAFSRDEGRSWTPPSVIPRSYPELLEIPKPCKELRSGDLVTTAAPFKLPDGTNPSGPQGIFLRSRDKGKTWDDKLIYFKKGNILPYESSLCEMQDGRLVAIVWAYDAVAEKHFPNHVTVSHDDGHTWSEPIDTGHMGQASSLLWLGEDILLTIHSHRAEDPGLYVRVVDFSGDKWRPVEEKVIWGSSLGQQTKAGQTMVQLFNSLRFGQPSLLRLCDGEILASHWMIEDGQGKIRTHRLRVKV